jgi:hypothetical protein
VHIHSALFAKQAPTPFLEFFDGQCIPQSPFYTAGFAVYITLYFMTKPTHITSEGDRLDAWYDGSAICIVAIGTHGDPLDLAEHEVEAFIEKLQHCLRQAKEADEKS